MSAAETQPTVIETLLRKGVRMPNPASVEIGDDLDPDRISGDGVTIHAGCRLRGATTVISAGCTLGAEGPVTIEDCQLGLGVDLKAGYFAKSVFLAGANMGSGAHVREGSILEEEANGAHCVGLKQTILFPFVTLGSLINFCDCLMSGGTSRSDHSEVGSSYIHFNFTPDGNKTTASLFGDVPRGVMLDQPAIFLGGQGGVVGPVRTGFGTVVAAGSVLRADVDDDGMLVTVDAPPGKVRPATRHTYRQLARIVERNVGYIASLDALAAWYRDIRQPFFLAQPLGAEVYEGAVKALASGRAERLKRLKALIGHLDESDEARRELRAHVAELVAVFGGEADPPPQGLVQEFSKALADQMSYIEAVKGLSAAAKTVGVAWLNRIIEDRTRRAAALVPHLTDH